MQPPMPACPCGSAIGPGWHACLALETTFTAQQGMAIVCRARWRLAEVLPVACMQVAAGTATPFTRAAAAARRRARHLLQTSPLPQLLPPTEPTGQQAYGDMFLPPCSRPAPCQTAEAVADWTHDTAETVVAAQCLPMGQINALYNQTQTLLANDTLYKVLVVPTDLAE